MWPGQSGIHRWSGWALTLDEGTGVSVLDELYCDPLPHQGFSTRISSANTTPIIGRKGTGKSTVFQKLQHDIRQTSDRLTAYIDIKTIWDSCQVSLELQERIAQTQYALPPASIERMLLYRAFLKSIVEEIQRELDKKLAGSMWERIKDTFSNRNQHGRFIQVKFTQKLSVATSYVEEKDTDALRRLTLMLADFKAGKDA